MAGMKTEKKSRSKLTPYLLGTFIVVGGGYGYYKWLNSDPSEVRWKVKNTDQQEQISSEKTISE